MELTLDEKFDCVLLHLNDNLPLYTISKERGINVARLKYCIDLYKKWGEIAFKKNEERRTYTRETKLILLFFRGISGVFEKNTSFLLGISKNTP